VKPPRALTVAGSDSGGGAGVAADLKTFEAHGVWGCLAVTAVTAQDTVGVRAVEVIPARLVRAQIDAVVADIGVGATKTGMLGGAEVVSTLARAARELDLGPLVVDPVAVSSTGARLLDDEGLDALRAELLPLAYLVTPNLEEAAALARSGPVVDRRAMEAVAADLLALGPGAVLVTGGHLDAGPASDLLAVAGEDPVWLEGERLAGPGTHGTGCVLSAAVTARLARGEALAEAVAGAKAFVTRAIAAGVRIGEGPAPVRPGGA
jgi:hydroxymethylpyrimidine/phosphomethylpyrimidine kinase